MCVDTSCSEKQRILPSMFEVPRRFSLQHIDDDVRGIENKFFPQPTEMPCIIIMMLNQNNQNNATAYALLSFRNYTYCIVYKPTKC